MNEKSLNIVFKLNSFWISLKNTNGLWGGDMLFRKL